VTFALRTVYLLYLAARDKRVPMLARVVATTCTAYVLSPINLIPNEIPVIGELDDAVVVALGIVGCQATDSRAPAGGAEGDGG
jgi:uncharacterized membrane protein YkvA (DUF1232 family)